MIPLLPALRDPDGEHLLVWCKYCDRYHHHRAPLTETPRIAHCPTDGSSPYTRSGYKLYDGGAAPARVARQAAKQRLRPEGRQW